MSDAVKFTEELRKEQLKMAPDQLNMAAGERTASDLAKIKRREPGKMDEQFPTDALGSEDPEMDREMFARLELQNKGSQGYTPFGKLEARDKDFKWLQEKEAAAEKANFQKWFAREFDMMSPAQKRVAKKLYPAYYAERKALLRKQCDNLFDLARIKQTGIEKYKDLVKVYMAETGRLDVGPLQNILNPEANNKNTKKDTKIQRAKFQRGLANPWTVFGKEALPSELATRYKEGQMFATRERDPEYTADANLGAQTGFPPFKSNETNQADREWWKVLKQTI